MYLLTSTLLHAAAGVLTKCVKISHHCNTYVGYSIQLGSKKDQLLCRRIIGMQKKYVDYLQNHPYLLLIFLVLFFSADILSSRTNSGEDFSFAGSESSSRRPSKVPFIYYVSTFLGFFGPPPPYPPI